MRQASHRGVAEHLASGQMFHSTTSFGWHHFTSVTGVDLNAPKTW